MSPLEADLPARLDVVGSWTVRSVAELADVRAELETRLPCGCSAARAPAGDDSLPGSLSGAQRMVLVASELVSNGLEHAEPPVTVRLLCDGHVAVLDVVDHSPDAAPVVPRDRQPGEGGFGLRLAERVADRVGWFRTAAGEKHVWAEFRGRVHVRPGAHPTDARARSPR
ncbi:hypothetical protein GCM10009809_11720 [Isoptericola hypogeus]|uniref:Histidine kinase/HSP90-like ATPase domain-containing protein n=1 Tax=Isoptericola hypogeus TaxID=300179 RepID=A0ABP4V985_9MICO